MVQSYLDLVSPQGEERHSRDSLSAASMMCTPTEENGFPKWLCVLRKCKDCGPLFNNEIKIDVSEGAPIIQFNAYLKKFIVQFMVWCQPVVPLVIHVIQLLKHKLFQVSLPPARIFLNRKIILVNHTKNIIFQVLKGWFIIDPITKLSVKTM